MAKSDEELMKASTDSLVDLFRRVCLPLPQRKPREDSRRGKTEKRKIEAEINIAVDKSPPMERAKRKHTENPVEKTRPVERAERKHTESPVKKTPPVERAKRKHTECPNSVVLHKHPRIKWP